MFNTQINNIWGNLKGNSTKTIFVLGTLTLISQMYQLWPLDTIDVIQITFSAAMIAFSVYTIQCLNVGGCTTFAWVTVLLPLIIYGLIFVLTMMMGKSVLNLAVPSSIVTEGGQPNVLGSTFGCSQLPRKNYSCDVPLQDKPETTKMYMPVSSSSQVDFYQKNQFRDYYEDTKDNYWQK